jgi:hypothetical protein
VRKLLLACLILPLFALRADARGCGNRCNEFVPTTVAVALGVPVATGYPVGFYWSPPPVVNVNVPPAPAIDYNALGQAVGQGVYAAINQANNQPVPQLPQNPSPITPPPMPPPPTDQPQPTPPANVPTPQPLPHASIQFNEANCIRCHNGSNAKATASIDMRLPLTAEQRLACTKALIQGTMPKGAPLSDPQQAAKIILELTGP